MEGFIDYYIGCVACKSKLWILGVVENGYDIGVHIQNSQSKFSCLCIYASIFLGTNYCCPSVQFIKRMKTDCSKCLCLDGAAQKKCANFMTKTMISCNPVNHPGEQEQIHTTSMRFFVCQSLRAEFFCVHSSEGFMVSLRDVEESQHMQCLYLEIQPC